MLKHYHQFEKHHYHRKKLAKKLGLNHGAFCMNTETPSAVINENRLRNTENSVLDMIKLDSSSNTVTSPEDAPEYSPQAWSYIRTDEFEDVTKGHSVNEQARQARRIIIENRQKYTLTPDTEYRDHLIPGDTNFTTDNLHKSNVTSNHPINCYTIIKKHFAYSDTSSDPDNCSNLELTQIGDVSVNHNRSEEYGDINTYDLDLQEKNRIVSIYSFKNKHLFAENDRDLINTSFDTDSSVCSLEKISEETNIHQSTDTCRIASPIPPIYMPRLDLSTCQTLSTVTELSDEPNRYLAPLKTQSPTKLVLKPKPINNWLDNHNELVNKSIGDTKRTSSNILNWLALSPRQEKRKYNIISNSKLQAAPIKLLKSFGHDREFLPDFAIQEMGNRFYANHKIKDINGITQITSNSVTEFTYKRPKVCNKKGLNEIIPIETVSTGYDTEKAKNMRTSRIPRIRISKKRPIYISKATSPIEKLDSNNWIDEDSLIKQCFINKYKLDSNADGVRDINNVERNNKLWSKNAKRLLKPAHWDEYQSIAESPKSLTLSFDSKLEKEPLLLRLIKCFRCCKRYK